MEWLLRRLPQSWTLPGATTADGSQRRPRTLRAIRRGWFFPLLLALLLVFGLGLPFVIRTDPNRVQMTQRLQPPSAEHWFGTDHLGRDLLARVIHGGRTTLSFGLGAVALTMLMALGIGMVAGYYGGRVDLWLNSLIDLILTLPTLLITLALLGILGVSGPTLIIALVGTAWAAPARILRAATLSIRSSGYVEAARAIGVPQPQILRRHIAPNIATPLLMLASLELADVLLVISALSFLGLGAQPPNADWGVMIAEGRTYIGQAPWLMWAPGLCIVFYAALANLAGDGLKQVLDQSFQRT
ncbi:MAG: ABC transporter permease [Blastochloris sp.]|nr:ABC transporter permease [Blastochloris sp.]